MFFEFLRFELRLRAKSPSTYVYFVLWLAFSFFCVASESFGPVGAANGKVLLNGPFANTLTDCLACLFGVIVIAAIFGTSILRDFQRDTYQAVMDRYKGDDETAKAQLEAHSVAFKDDAMLQTVKIQGMEAAANLMAARDRHQEAITKATEEYPVLQASIKLKAAMALPDTDPNKAAAVAKAQKEAQDAAQNSPQVLAKKEPWLSGKQTIPHCFDTLLAPRRGTDGSSVAYRAERECRGGRERRGGWHQSIAAKTIRRFGCSLAKWRS